MESTPFSEFDLSGKVALVTGAARGMGREFALALGKYGADLVVCDILPELEKIKPEIERLGRRVLIQQTDLYKIPEIHAMVNESTRVFGRIDILVITQGSTSLNGRRMSRKKHGIGSSTLISRDSFFAARPLER